MEATHCLVRSHKNFDDVPVPLKTLARRRIHVLLAVYLSDYLTIDPPPTPESAYPDVFKRCF